MVTPICSRCRRTYPESHSLSSISVCGFHRGVEVVLVVWFHGGVRGNITITGIYEQRCQVSCYAVASDWEEGHNGCEPEHEGSGGEVPDVVPERCHGAADAGVHGDT